MKKSIIIEIIVVILLAIILGILVKFTIEAIDQNNKVQIPNQNMIQPNGGGVNTTNITYTASKEITEDMDIEKGEYSSETADENGLLVSGDIDVSLSNIEVNKTGDSDGGDNTSFYGINSAIIAKDGANLELKEVIVTTNATGSNGVFSYGRSSYN